MVSVDDLVISLRIDPTSNLGNLQKQLTALVGPKGDKAIGIGLDADTKRDLRIIRDRIVKFTPSVLMDANLKEAADALASDLKKDTGLRDQLIQKYSINIVKYENFLDELFNISLGISELNSDQQKIFIAEMDTFRKLADTTKGQLKTAITRLTSMLLEKNFQKRVVAAFREAGVGMLSKPRVFQLTEESMDKQLDATIKRFKEDDPTGFAALEKIFLDHSDSLEATSIAYKLQTGKTLDLTQLSQKKIYDTVELHKIIAAQASAALTKAQWMQGVFYKAAKQLFTKTAFAVEGSAELDSIIGSVSAKTLEKLGIEHLVGDKIDKSMTNVLTEFKTVLGKGGVDYEAVKRLNTQNNKRLFFFAEEFTEGALERIRYYNELEENKNKQIGAYKLTPRAVELLLGMASNLDEKAIRSKKEHEENLEDDEESKKSLLSPIDKLEERTQKIIAAMPTDPKEQREYLIKVFDMQEELKREMKTLIGVVKVDQAEIDRRHGKGAGIPGTVGIEDNPMDDDK